MGNLENYKANERIEYLKKLSSELTEIALTEGISKEEVIVLLEFFNTELNFKWSNLN